jgi:hypothetical protein
MKNSPISVYHYNSNNLHQKISARKILCHKIVLFYNRLAAFGHGRDTFGCPITVSSGLYADGERRRIKMYRKTTK